MSTSQLACRWSPITWYLTIRGRGESARVVFTMLGIFVFLTIIMAIGLFIAKGRGVPAGAVYRTVVTPTLWEAMYHMLTASMKGLVALSGLEAMSNGIQFVINEDAGIVKWGKKHLPRLQGIWDFYSGKSGIGRLVQTSFLFYGGVTTAFLAYFAFHFNVFDGTLGRSLVANLSFIAFTQIPGGEVLYFAYQILAVGLLTAASMTAFQDLQATEWRDVAIGEIPEIIVYRDKRGTFTRSVTIAFVVVIIITFIIRGNTSAGRSLLWHRRFHADHDDGFRDTEAYLEEFHRTQALLGQPGSRFCRGAFGDCFCRTDRRKMDGRRLGCIDFVQRAGHYRQFAFHFAHWFP